MQHKNVYRVWLLAIMAFLAIPAALRANETAEANELPQLEIRNYRFSQFTPTTDRLVLEFERKDATGKKLSVKTNKNNGEWNVDTDNVMLLGAIPENLITESYRKPARYLGLISVNMESATTGFSIKVSTKHGAHVKAQWLANPTRLVIDAISGRAVAHRETLSFERMAPKRPGLDELMCFPATAKVNLTVTFQPRANRQEELQNIRINTDGTTLAPEAQPPADAIVCYPRRMQIGATLSYEDRIQNAFLGQKSHSHELFAPAEAGHAAKVQEKTLGHESDLDPAVHAPAPAAAAASAHAPSAPMGLGQLPFTGGASGLGARAPAEAAVPAVAPPAPPVNNSPLGLLPALNN